MELPVEKAWGLVRDYYMEHLKSYPAEREKEKYAPIFVEFAKDREQITNEDFPEFEEYAKEYIEKLRIFNSKRVRTLEEYMQFYDRYRCTMSSDSHTDDEWENLIPKIKMFEVARRIKTISGFESDYTNYYWKKLGYRKDYTKKEIVEDFYQYCRDIDLRKKITKIRKIQDDRTK